MATPTYNNRRLFKHLGAKTSALALAVSMSAGTAQAEGDKQYFNIQTDQVGEALTAFATQTNNEIVFASNIVKEKTTAGVTGEYTEQEALKLILANTGLVLEKTEDNVFLVMAEGNQEGEEKKSVSRRQSSDLQTSTITRNAQAGKERGPLEEITVTALKREQRLIDIPISVAAITGKDLDSKGITDLQSLSFSVPGLFVSETGSNQRRISIRGIGNTFGDSSLVGIYLDEASVAVQPAYQLDLRVHDLERIEVLKGPQGTLYGEGSVGGTIRYITKDPQLGGVGGDISIDGSTTESGDTSHEVKGILNTPLTDTLGLRIVGQYAKTGGWIDQPALGKKDINDQEVHNMRAKLLWLPADNLEIKTTAITHRNDVGAQNIGEDDNGNYRQSFDDPSTPSGKDDYDFFNLLVSYDFGSVNLTSSTSYLNSDKRVNNFSGQCCGPIDTSREELLNLLFLFENRSTTIKTQELRLSSNNTELWHWSTGLFYKDATFTNNNDLRAGNPGVIEFLISTRIEQTSESWALFGEAGYAITDNLEVGLGLRYFEDDQEVLPGGTASPGQETFDSLNPKVYLSYHFTEDLHFYANAAKGFRSGGFNVFQPPGAPTYDPESVWSYELGSKLSAMDGRLSAEFALFYSDYEDYQTNSLVGGLNFTSNAGSAEIQGVDLSFTFSATENTQLGFAGNYTDTEFTEINESLIGKSHIEGDPLDLVPQYGFSVWSQYSFNWFDGSPGFARIDYSQQGKSNTRARRLDVPAIGFVYHSTSDVIRMLNTRVGWEGQTWSIELYALNLLDEDGFVNPFEISRGSPRPRPRTVGLNAAYRF